VEVRNWDGTPKDFWLKSHPNYPTDEYPFNLDCYVSFKTRYNGRHQYVMFEVLSGSIAGDAYLAFGNDYGDTEKHSAVEGFKKIVSVSPGNENKDRLMMHWYSGATVTDKGFLVKVSVHDSYPGRQAREE